ncbi:MAG: hypothetical protein JNM58_06260 [Xanthomonadaceae bacterium]|nr:hypothetical protein [Xanthomonadaceae bacterium]
MAHQAGGAGLMGSLADFLKQRERDATRRDDSQAGTTTPQGRPGMRADVMGCENGRAALESRDSQGVAHSPCMEPLEVVSGGPSHSHAFAKQHDDSQVGVAERPGTHGASCDAVGHANRRQSTESRDSQGCEGVRTMLTAIARDRGIPEAVVDAIDPRDLGACAGLPAATLGAYLRALHRSRQMTAGVVPAGWTHVARCTGCGPVWLPPTMPANVRACPWCLHRRNGRHPPTPHP